MLDIAMSSNIYLYFKILADIPLDMDVAAN